MLAKSRTHVQVTYSYVAKKLEAVHACGVLAPGGIHFIILKKMREELEELLINFSFGAWLMQDLYLRAGIWFL